jgi:hypothetical protein
MCRIETFCSLRINSDSASAYKSGRFRQLSELAKALSIGYGTRPGRFSNDVSKRNNGETAFQRALFNAKSAILETPLGKESIEWLDGELPIVCSDARRRRCVDLIGRSERIGTFLCELKYTQGGRFGEADLPDYAIFQVLLYSALVSRNASELAGTHHTNGIRFNWHEVGAKNMLVVLGNSLAWKKSQENQNPIRIARLIEDVHRELGLLIFVCSGPDCAPNPRSEKRYRPSFLPASTPPVFKVIDFQRLATA